jgi:signal transduction histidine kinase/DNA-binding response OmpR family regulator
VLSAPFDDPGDPGGERASILIVDDLPEKLLVFRTVLEDLGHEIVCVRSGGEALKEILRQEFAVILLDVNMPDIDGFETAGLIRQYKRSAHTPIIFVTSYVDEMQTIRGYSLGAVDYILSPMVPEILRSKVKVFVDLHLMQRRLRQHADERVELARAEAARAVAEENTRRSNFLSEASRVLSGSLDVATAAHRLLEMLVPQFLPKAHVILFDEHGEVGLHVAAEAADGSAGPARLSPRAPDTVPEADLAALRSALAAAAPLPTPATTPAGVVLPLVTAGSVLGGVIAEAGPDADWGSIHELIGRAAIALENARLYRSVQVEIEERRGVEAKLQESNRRKDEFLAMLSHELRNPLAPIRTALEVVRRLPTDEPKLHWATDIMGRQVSHLTRLVEDLLDVARINQGKIALQTESLDLRDVLTHGVETVKPFLESRRHHLTRLVPDTPVWMRGDFARLSQVVANLLNNASKYTEEGGAIELSLTVSEEGQAVIGVSDNGIGIDAELLPNVFELFEQGKRALDRSQGGLGVGLTLVRRLVELHGGTVAVTSAGPGTGSQFRVRLPCVSEAVHPDRAAANEPADPVVGCRVLVVDDNRDAAEAAAVFLAMAGHEVKAVGEGTEALACAPVFAPDVIVLDIGLPVMDGYEVARRLRGLPETRASLLIALTGYGQRGDRDRARDAGFDHHLTKPAEPDELLAIIEAWCAARAAAAPADEPLPRAGNLRDATSRR